MTGSALYKAGQDLRPQILRGSDERDNILIAQPALDVAPAATQPTTLPFAKAPVFFSGGSIQTTQNTPDGKIAVIIRGNVLLTQRSAGGDYIELQADEAVLYTTLTQFTEAAGDLQNVQDAIQSAYCEGDVRISFTPAAGKVGRAVGEQRLRAKRAFYEFGSNRAVLTDVVVQTTDPKLPFPITMRANYAKQLSMGEYKAQGVTLTTSQFAKPSYSINASKAYVRQYQDPNPLIGTRTAYQADNATFRTFGVPIFWFPYAAGDIATNAFPLRGVSIGSSRGMGFGVESTWGLFESAGYPAPPGLDTALHLDYYSDRGPAAGLDAKYEGGQLAQTNKGLWNFKGNFSVYGVQDHGADNLGRDRAGVEDDGFRGRLMWEHQHLLPNDWQAQFRVGLTSDATFLEEWYRKQFVDGLPTNVSAYFKHQNDNEAVTFLAEFQPNGVVTNSEDYANRFVGDRSQYDADGLGSLADRPFEVERLPEVGYYKLGESFDSDQLTFLSENRLGGYRMHEGDAMLTGFNDSDNYGFRVRDKTDNENDRFATPGIPSLGYTGTSEDYTVRGDFRQEVDYPIDAGRFKVVPYVFGRYTGYSDSPDGDPQNRILAGVGTRINTAFWRVDEAAQSEFFDIHRVRHVIEPELNLFASASSVDREDVYIYDDTIDGINDVSAASFFIRQRWQTKRGATGMYRSVDFLTLNVGIIGFANLPNEVLNPDRAYARSVNADYENELGPTSAKGFRGLFFQSTPEASIPRSSVQGDASWRVSDTTLLMTDASWNIKEQQLSTAAVGLLVGRGDRVTYFTGLRYIGEIDSTIASFSTTYQITSKYTVNLGLAVDLARDSKGGNVAVIRKFDRFYLGLGGYYDQTDNESGLTVSFFPEGLAGVNSGQLSQFQR
ncbi:MAG: LPS assembly protein LptD [Tepidisphaeraceae bacterium]